ncbi:MAG: hypothetical protein QOD06_3390, partial [Candidatus Binatota bacterium]|nr:hypothetical protein [Candidatus Binatota bacterium]
MASRGESIAGVRRHLLANVRAHVVARAAQVAVGIGLVPYVLAHLPRAQYGLWAWLLGATAYLALADFGLSQGNVRPLASAIASGDLRRRDRIVTAAIAFHSALGLAALFLAFALRHRIAASFPEGAREEA